MPEEYNLVIHWKILNEQVYLWIADEIAKDIRKLKRYRPEDSLFEGCLCHQKSRLWNTVREGCLEFERHRQEDNK